MSYRITIDLPNLSKGQGVAITGLGEFENGKSYEISDEQHEEYRTLTSRQVDVVNDRGVVVGWQTERGPTLKQSKFQEGITVEVAKEDPPKKQEPPKKDEPEVVNLDPKGDDK